MKTLNAKKKPCYNCPMRLDQTKPEWSPQQIERLLPIDDQPQYDAENYKQMFTQMACHKSVEGKEFQCTGWVISQIQNGITNIGLRMAIGGKRIKLDDYDQTFPVHSSITKAFENKAIN